MGELQQVVSGLDGLCSEIGPEADVHIFISSSTQYSSGSARVTVMPRGVLGKVSLSAAISSLGDAVEVARNLWSEHEALHKSNTIKSMAIAVIRLTAENGECSDAALRCEFSQQDIDRYGDEASDLATEMGGNGPFQIVRLGVGNMPEAA